MASLANLEIAWEKQFPRTDFLTKTLRQILIQADALRLNSESAFAQLQRDLHKTRLPMSFWNRQTHHIYTQVRRYALQAQRHFFLALKNIQAICKSTPPPEQQPVQAPPDSNQDSQKLTVYQTIRFHFDPAGNFICAQASPTASELLIQMPNPNVASYVRQFKFPNCAVPEPYRSLLTNKDQTLEAAPKEHFSIGYSPEVFYKLCFKELETNSPHLLDHPDRVFYMWLD